MKNLIYVMKDLRMTNKLKVYVLIWLKKLEFIAFGGLGKALNSSLAIERLCFSGQIVEYEVKVNHQKWSEQAELK